MFLKSRLAVIAASITGAVLWIEHGHRIDIATPTGAALAASVAACPGNDSVPYSTDCIVFMQGSATPDRRGRVHAAERTTDVVAAVELAAPACPANNENVPYSADCIRFMSGWFWQVSAVERPAAVSVSVDAPK